MRSDKNITKILAHTAHVMNVINGGMTMSSSALNKKEDHYLLQVQVPGVHPELLSVEIHQNFLFIFQLMDVAMAQPIPYLINRLNIPSDVDYQSISAEFTDHKLNVVLPFNELAGGYHRAIDISKH